MVQCFQNLLSNSAIFTAPLPISVFYFFYNKKYFFFSHRIHAGHSLTSFYSSQFSHLLSSLPWLLYTPSPHKRVGLAETWTEYDMTRYNNQAQNITSSLGKARDSGTPLISLSGVPHHNTKSTIITYICTDPCSLDNSFISLCETLWVLLSWLDGICYPCVNCQACQNTVMLFC